MHQSLAAVPRLIWCCRPVVDPLKVVGHSGVDAIVPRSGAALPPADDPQQESCRLILGHQGSTAVTFTRVLTTLNISGAKHVLSEHYATLIDTVLRADSRHLQASKDLCGRPIFAPPPPATHCVQPDHPEHTGG